MKTKKSASLISVDEYHSQFSPKRDASSPDKDSKLALAFEQVIDNRKNEIELYWKRAQYFWTFIAAAFTGYGVVLTVTIQSTEVLFMEFTILLLGTVFSVAWYFVNRGSKYWQINWDEHARSMEDGVVGPLFKTMLGSKEFRLLNLLGAYPFSVTQINHLLNIYVMLIWACMLARFVCYHIYLFDIRISGDWSFWAAAIISLGIILMLFLCRTGPGRRGFHRFVDPYEAKE